jgi:hypothetical protein
MSVKRQSMKRKHLVMNVLTKPSFPKSLSGTQYFITPGFPITTSGMTTSNFGQIKTWIPDNDFGNDDHTSAYTRGNALQ